MLETQPSITALFKQIEKPPKFSAVHDLTLDIDDDVELVEEMPTSNCYSVGNRFNGDLALFFQNKCWREFPRVGFKVSLTQNGKDLDLECFQRAQSFLTMFTRQGIASLERGNKKGQMHMHMMFQANLHTNISAQLRSFIKLFLLGYVPETVYTSLCEKDKALLQFTNEAELKCYSSGHKISVSVIDCSKDSFQIQTGYALKDIGKPHFRAAVFKMRPRDLQLSYSEYQKIKKHDDADGMVIHHKELARKLRHFIRDTFAEETASEVCPVVGLYHLLDKTDQTLDSDVVTPLTGNPLNLARVAAWLNIREKKFTAQDVHRAVFDGSNKISSVEFDVSEERFERLIENRETAPLLLKSDLSAFETVQFEYLKEANSGWTRAKILNAYCCLKGTMPTAVKENLAVSEDAVITWNTSKPAAKKLEGRHCSICKEHGHDRRICPKKQPSSDVPQASHQDITIEPSNESQPPVEEQVPKQANKDVQSTPSNASQLLLEEQVPKPAQLSNGAQQLPRQHQLSQQASKDVESTPSEGSQSSPQHDAEQSEQVGQPLFQEQVAESVQQSDVSQPQPETVNSFTSQQGSKRQLEEVSNVVVSAAKSQRTN